MLMKPKIEFCKAFDRLISLRFFLVAGLRRKNEVHYRFYYNEIVELKIQ